MPLCRVITNVKDEQISDGFNAALTNILAQKLNRDSKAITVHVAAGNRVTRGGNSPNGYVELVCSSGYGSLQNKRDLTNAITDLAKQELNITDPNGLLVFFNVPSPCDIGINGGLASDKK